MENKTIIDQMSFSKQSLTFPINKVISRPFAKVVCRSGLTAFNNISFGGMLTCTAPILADGARERTLGERVQVSRKPALSNNYAVAVRFAACYSLELSCGIAVGESCGVLPQPR
jgi:hypothetical protein